METDKETPNATAFLQVGDVCVTTISDGFRRIALTDGWVLNASVEELNAELARAGLRAAEVINPYNPILLEGPSYCALIDTGNGTQPADSTYGRLSESLAAAGVPHERIDTVIISHGHADHVLGLIDPHGQPTFPRAHVLVPGPEWRFWMDDAEMARARAGRIADLFALNRRVLGAVGSQLATFEWGEELLPGLTAVSTPGHSVGHTSFLLESRGQKLFFLSDLVHVPVLFMTHPDWHPAYDQDPIAAESVRRRVLRQLAGSRILVHGFHFPFPGRGFIERNGDAFIFVPQPDLALTAKIEVRPA